jgi:hypothetical protein
MEISPREFEVELPIGYTDGDGVRHRRALIRKMRGHEEALLYDTSLNGAQLVTALLAGCLVKLGHFSEIGRDVVSRMYSTDRNYLLLEIRRITLGDRLQATYLCPGCNNSVTGVEDLGHLDVRRLAEGETLPEIAVRLEDGCIDRHGNPHFDIKLRLPRGTDEEFVAPMMPKDPLKAEDALLLRCIERFGTLTRTELEAYGVKILRDMTFGDRLRLHQVLNDGTPGVNFLRSVTCDKCQMVFSGLLDITRFFAPG